MVASSGAGWEANILHGDAAPIKLQGSLLALLHKFNFRVGTFNEQVAWMMNFMTFCMSACLDKMDLTFSRKRSFLANTPS